MRRIFHTFLQCWLFSTRSQNHRPLLRYLRLSVTFRCTCSPMRFFPLYRKENLLFFVKNSIIKFLLCYLRLYHRILHFYIDLSKNTTVNNEIKLNSNLLLAIRYINDNISYQFSIDELAKAANTSISTLERNFCHFLGMTPSKYIRQRRLGIAIGYLNSGKSVTEDCFDSGFSDCSKFISLFKRNFGMTPLKYKKKFSRQ